MAVFFTFPLLSRNGLIKVPTCIHPSVSHPVLPWEKQAPMATSSLSALTHAFSSSLSFSSSVSSKPSVLSFSQVQFPRAASTRRLNPIVAASSSLTAVGAVAGSASISEEEVEGLCLEKYVKSQLPDGFAAQRTIGTGRRKCAIARVVLQGGTGKFVINYRDAQEYLQGNPLWLQYIKTPL